MLDKKIGFLGGGAMAEAMADGIVKGGAAKAENIYICDHKAARCEFFREKYGVNADTDSAILKGMDIAVLAVKPQVFKKAADELKAVIGENAAVISILAGISLDVLEKEFPKNRVIRVMPNTPMAVGEGMAAIAAGKKCTQDDIAAAKLIFEAAGRAIVIKENLMDAVTGLSGSGPAYGFVMIDALSDAGVAAGLKRGDAVTLAAQTLLGAAKMVLETKKHPSELRDMVTSPAGTTIEGVMALEKHGVRGALIEAVLAAVNKSKAMGTK
jgi:pyrroline-5-carboxylate reductase